MNQSHPKILILAVHYKTEPAVLAFLDSLKRLRGFADVHAIVMDNASGEEHLRGIRQAVGTSPNLRLIELPENRGYLGAAKLGLNSHLVNHWELPNWIIVSNSDIVFVDDRFLEKLTALDRYSVGMVAPQIIVPLLHLDQNPFMRKRPNALKRFAMRLHSHDYFSSVAWDWLARVKRLCRSTRVRGEHWHDTAAQYPIFAPHGSFMIFSQKYFEAGGYLDDELFLFCEEISVGEICHSLGLPVIYNSSLSVVHNEHQSLGFGMTRFKFGHHRRSIRHVLSRYLGGQSHSTKV